MGLENALTEITLVLFTTLAPSGIVACMAMMALLLGSRPSASQRAALNKYLCIPVLVALVGLVASATHLGNPANALYVLTGVGRSPLSNEVFAGVVFFGLVGSYWFYSFTRTRHASLERAWLALGMAAGLVFLVAIAFAYQVDTIITWSHPLVPVALMLNALVGGPLLALVGFSAVRRDDAGSDGDGQGADSVADGGAIGAGEGDGLIWARISRLCVTVSVVALVANVIVYVLLGIAVLPLQNSTGSAALLVPHYQAIVTLFAIVCAAGIVVQAASLRMPLSPTLAPSIASALLALVGIFAMRFVFYMLHMTVGVF